MNKKEKKERIIPLFTHQTKEDFDQLSRTRQRNLVLLAQYLKPLVERELVPLTGKRARLPQYTYSYHGLTVVFHLSPQSGTPVILQISH